MCVHARVCSLISGWLIFESISNYILKNSKCFSKMYKKINEMYYTSHRHLLVDGSWKWTSWWLNIGVVRKAAQSLQLVHRSIGMGRQYSGWKTCMVGPAVMKRKKKKKLVSQWGISWMAKKKKMLPIWYLTKCAPYEWPGRYLHSVTPATKLLENDWSFLSWTHILKPRVHSPLDFTREM